MDSRHLHDIAQVAAFAEEDLRDLVYAKELLEHPSLAARVADAIGKPVELIQERLPEKWGEVVNQATLKAIRAALELALTTLKDPRPRISADRFHKLLVTGSGGVGGMFGIMGLPVELPVSTTIMMRSILDIARSEGEDLRQAEAKLSCLEVFALGGPTRADDAAEYGYFTVRATMGKAISDAAKYIAQRGLAEEGAPAITRVIALIASRFGMVVSQKVAGQIVVGIGAAFGAVINLLFMDHFQNMARGHFIVRRLERKYGEERVRQEYASCTSGTGPARQASGG